MSKRVGNSIVVGTSSSGKTHTGLHCSVQLCDRKAVKRSLYAASNAVPLEYDESTYEAWDNENETC